MVGRDKSSLDRAHEYLEFMRQGIFEDDTGQIAYVVAFEDAIAKSRISRAAALTALGADEDEVQDLHFLYAAACARDSLDELRGHEADGNEIMAYASYLEICEFLQNEHYEVDREEAAGILGLSEPDFLALAERYEHLRKTYGNMPGRIKGSSGLSTPEGFDPNLN